jgi:hypothetical protein
MQLDLDFLAFDEAVEAFFVFVAVFFFTTLDLVEATLLMIPPMLNLLLL